MLRTKQPSPPASLADRIAAIHAEIDALIDKRAAEIKKNFEGTFSLEYIKFDLKKNAFHCPCRQYLELPKDEGQ